MRQNLTCYIFFSINVDIYDGAESQESRVKNQDVEMRDLSNRQL